MTNVSIYALSRSASLFNEDFLIEGSVSPPPVCTARRPENSSTTLFVANLLKYFLFVANLLEYFLCVKFTFPLKVPYLHFDPLFGQPIGTYTHGDRLVGQFHRSLNLTDTSLVILGESKIVQLNF